MVAGRPLLELARPERLARDLFQNTGLLLILGNLLGENSMYGLLMRSLAEPLFPVWLEMFSLRSGKFQKYPYFPGYRQYGRVIRGSVNALERNPPPRVSARSRTITERPARASEIAALSPFGPEPTTTAS